MNINEKDIIVLDDDHHYLVLKKLNYENTKYYYISDLDQNGNINLLYENGNELVEVEDKEILDKVIIKMCETIDMDDLLRSLKVKLEEKAKNNDVNNN